MSSRAIIRIGYLNVVETLSIAGHIFTFYDEKNNRVVNVKLNMAGHEFETNEGKKTPRFHFLTPPFLR